MSKPIPRGLIEARARLAGEDLQSLDDTSENDSDVVSAVSCSPSSESIPRDSHPAPEPASAPEAGSAAYQGEDDGDETEPTALGAGQPIPRSGEVTERRPSAGGTGGTVRVCSAAELGQLLHGPGLADRYLIAGGVEDVPELVGTVKPPDWSSSGNAGRTHRVNVVRLTRPDGGTVDVCDGAVYFGETDGRDIAAAGAAVELVKRSLREATGDQGLQFDRHPSAIGRLALLRGLHPKAEHETPVPELGEAIRKMTPQHRFEKFQETEPTDVETDVRMAYMGKLCQGVEMPAGQPSWLESDEPLRHPGFARVEVEVPAHWERCGLVHAPHEGGGWVWPAEPGERFTTWLTTRELHLLDKFRWDPGIVEQIRYPSRARALELWAGKIRSAGRMIENCSEMIDGPEVSSRARALAGRMLRTIALESIGAMHSGVRWERKSAADWDTVPVDAYTTSARPHRNPETGRVEWLEASGHGGWPRLTYHPEWTVTLWAHVRAMMMHHTVGGRGGTEVGATTVPRSQLVGIAGDALRLRSDPGWPDDGEWGRLRVKS